MARTQIHLDHQVVGNNLTIGNEAAGEAGKLVIHADTGNTESVLLDIKGIANISGKLKLGEVMIDTSGMTEGQTLAFDGTSIRPTTLPASVFTRLQKDAPNKKNTLFILKDANDASNGLDAKGGKGGLSTTLDSEINYNVINDPKFVDMYNQTYDATKVGYTVFVNVGNGYLTPVSRLGLTPTLYQDLFNGRTSGIPNYNELPAALKEYDDKLMFTIDTTTGASPDYTPTAMHYNMTANVKVIPLANNYDASQSGKKVYHAYKGMFISSTSYYTTQTGPQGSIAYSSETYDQFYTNGVLTPTNSFFYTDYILNTAPNKNGGQDNYIFDASPIGYLTTVEGTNSIVLRDVQGGINSDSIYVKDVDATKITLNGKAVYSYVGTGANSFLSNGSSVSSGSHSHAEGSGTTASGLASHAEGSGTTASGLASHAEGSGTTASGIASHVEGYLSKAFGDYSHAEGRDTWATGHSSHSEGMYTRANGEGSHAQGYQTDASGLASHAGGYGLGGVVSARGVASFNHSHRNYSYTGSGASANYSAILGGTNNTVNSGATNSVVLGGDGLVATEPDTVYVPNLDIRTGLKINGQTVKITTNKAFALSGAVDGVNKVFTYTPAITADSLQIYMNGLLQSYMSGDDYTVNYTAKTVTFLDAPYENDKIIAYGSF